MDHRSQRLATVEVRGIFLFLACLFIVQILSLSMRMSSSLKEKLDVLFLFKIFSCLYSVELISFRICLCVCVTYRFQLNKTNLCKTK